MYHLLSDKLEISFDSYLSESKWHSFVNICKYSFVNICKYSFVNIKSIKSGGIRRKLLHTKKTAFYKGMIVLIVLGFANTYTIYIVDKGSW